MITRKEYMSGSATHAEYYGQFVTDMTKKAVSAYIGMEKLRASTDEHMNDIPLKLWDSAPVYTIQGAFEKCGDFFTLSAKVCIAKQAARMVLNELSTK